MRTTYVVVVVGGTELLLEVVVVLSRVSEMVLGVL